MCYNPYQSNEGNECLQDRPERQGEPSWTESGLLAAADRRTFQSRQFEQNFEQGQSMIRRLSELVGLSGEHRYMYK
jgi:hypothetical protein